MLNSVIGWFFVCFFFYSALRYTDKQYESCPEIPEFKEGGGRKRTSEMDVPTRYLAVLHQPNRASGQKPVPQLVQISLAPWKSMLPCRFATPVNLHPGSKGTFKFCCV